MGNKGSKLDKIKEDNSSKNAIPLGSPKAKPFIDDPRSPTTDIVRTPIQIVPNVNNETPIIGVLKDDGTESAIDIDPRSPTVEFLRTPIITGDLGVKLKNKNLERVKQQANYLPPSQQTESEKVTSPKLISVTPIVKIKNREKRRSYIGLLETNLDFVETDLDKVMKLNSIKYNILEDQFNNLSVGNSETIKVDEEDDVDIFEDCRTNNDEPIIVNEIVDEIKESICNDVVLLEKTNENIIEDKCLEIKIEEEIIAIIDKQHIEITPEDIIETKIEVEQMKIENEEKITFTKEDTDPSVAEFERKVDNLIYEDEILDIVMKAPISKNQNRTPLSDRNNKQMVKKSVNKLKVHDQPQKKNYAVSKIPVFKNKKGRGKITHQCENTPPAKKVEKKPNQSQWDSDKTLII